MSHFNFSHTTKLFVSNSGPQAIFRLCQSYSGTLEKCCIRNVVGKVWKWCLPFTLLLDALQGFKAWWISLLLWLGNLNLLKMCRRLQPWIWLLFQQAKGTLVYLPRNDMQGVARHCSFPDIHLFSCPCLYPHPFIIYVGRSGSSCSCPASICSYCHQEDIECKYNMGWEIHRSVSWMDHIMCCWSPCFTPWSLIIYDDKAPSWWQAIRQKQEGCFLCNCKAYFQRQSWVLQHVYSRTEIICDLCYQPIGDVSTMIKYFHILTNPHIHSPSLKSKYCEQYAWFKSTGSGVLPHADGDMDGPVQNLLGMLYCLADY